MRHLPLLILALAFFTVVSLAETAATIQARIDEADRLFGEKDFTGASRLYESIIALHPNRGISARIYLQLGKAYKETGFLDKARAAFSRVIEAEGPLPPNSVGLSHWAQWGIGETLFAQKNYAGALEAFRLEATYPFSSSCGNALRSHHSRILSNIAILYEYLYQYDQAVSTYLSNDAFSRLLRLYTEAGQMDDFLWLLRKTDQQCVDRMNEKVAAGTVNGLPLEHCSTYDTYMRIVESAERTRELEENREWDKLVKVLDPGVGEDSRNYDVEEAARLAAKHPAKTVPLLGKVLQRPEWADLPWGVCQALGLAGTPEAVMYLKRKAQEERNYWRLLSLVKALILAGRPGAIALDELYPESNGNLHLILERHRSGQDLEPRGQSDFAILPFPPIPKGTKLPSRCRSLYPAKNEYICDSPRSQQEERHQGSD